MRRLLLHRRLLPLHVLVLAFVVATVLLGRWQLQRLGEVRDRSARVEERLAQDAVPLTRTGAGDTTAVGDDAGEREYRRVRLTGTYDVDRQVLIRSRQRNGQSGFHLVTPLVRDDGTATLVNRGWIPFGGGEPPVADARPPSGQVTVTGFLQPTEHKPAVGLADPAEGVLDRLHRVDVGRIDQQTPYPLEPGLAYVTLQDQTPGQPGRLPVRVPEPTFDAGRHLSYAIQWFAFGTVAVGSYAAYLAKRRREQDRDDQAPDTSEPGADTTAASVHGPERTTTSAD